MLAIAAFIIPYPYLGLSFDWEVELEPAMYSLGKRFKTEANTALSSVASKSASSFHSEHPRRA